MPHQVRFPILPVRTGHMTFTIPRLTPGGLLSVRLSSDSPGAFPQIRIRLVALLRWPPDFGASPCTRLSRAPQVGRYSHEYYHRSATSHTPGFGPYLALFPPGCFPFRALFWLGLWRIRLGSPRAYSPLSLASRARLPVSPTMDSAMWGRWWFAAHPNRALRLPA